MTREEMLLAAEAAEGYPEGYGYWWGHGPLYQSPLSDADLSANPGFG